MVISLNHIKIDTPLHELLPKLSIDTGHCKNVWRGALKEKYHYYIIGFALPEDCALLGCGVYLLMTNASALVKVGMSVFGGSG